MKRKIVLALLFSTFLVGCDTSKITDMLPKKEPELIEGVEYQYDENGELILDEAGNPMEAIIELPPPTLEETLGFGSKELIENMLSYPGMVVTMYDYYNAENNVTFYQVDNTSKVAVKYEFDADDGLVYSFYDNNKSTAYTNVNSTGWQKLDNERVTQIVPLINSATFTETSFYQEGDYLYLEGTMTPGTDKTIINQTIRNLFKNAAENFRVYAVYNAYDKSLLTMRITLTSYANDYTIAFTPINEQAHLSIPQNVLDLLDPNSVGVESFGDILANIPNHVLLHYALFDCETTDVTKDKIIDTFSLIASELQRTYQGIDVDKFIDACINISTNNTIDSFATAKAEGVYASIEESAAADMLYARLLKVDASITEEQIQKVVAASPDPNAPVEEPTEEPTEEPVVEEPVVEEPAKVYAEANTDVNVRKGPSTSFDKIGRIEKGTIVTVVKVDENDSTWTYVILPNGVEGCIKNTYLNTIEQVESEVQSNE